MVAPLRVYSRIHEDMGYVVFRINRELVKRAPKVVEFVDKPQGADCQIVHCIGSGSLTRIWNDNFILIQHNPSTSDILSQRVWLGVYQQALLVVSYADLREMLGTNCFNFLLTPWGVDTTVFFNKHKRRARKIVTTGWSCTEEAIEEVYRAATACRMKAINVGDDFKFGSGFSAVSRVTDGELCDIYNGSEYVSGLRFTSGFELPVIEGLASGCRPICFDLPVYRKWFGHFPVFVPHCRGTSLVDILTAVLSQPTANVTEAEVAQLRQTFDWQVVAESFWTAVLELA